MDIKTSSRIMMISTHGYVTASPEFGKPDTGGQVVYVLELSKWLAKLGSRVDIYTRHFEDQPQIESVIGDCVRIIRLPCGGPEFVPKEWLCDSIPEWVDNTLRYIRTHGLVYDRINSHYWDAGLAGQSLSRQLSVPHLHTPHSIGSWKRDNMPGSAEELEKKYNFRRRISSETEIYAACSEVIATTPAQREIVTGSPYHVDPRKVRLIPAGYDDSRFFPIAEASKQIIKQQLGLEGRIVLAIGRLARNKGYDLLIRAMRPVCERLPDVKLVLAIGSSSLNADEQKQLAELKSLAQLLDLSDRIDFRGYIPDDELPNMYRAADVFALSSRYEPFGMTAVEAMACGVSTIVTTEGGLWKQVQWGVETLYANPNDPEAFGHSILDVLQYPEVAQQLELHGATKARSSFTWSSVAQDFMRLAQEGCTPEPINSSKSTSENSHHVTGLCSREDHDMNALPWLLVCDLDGTLLGDDESLLEFRRWSRNLNVVRIAYATGRNLESVLECLAHTVLPIPDFLITNIGTEIWSMPTASEIFQWPIVENCNWNRILIMQHMEGHTDIELQPEVVQSDFKVSYFANQLSQSRLRNIAKELADLELDFELIYSGGRYLDFLPPNSHKGAAVDALGKHLNVPRDRIIVAGDSGNDVSMFQLGFRGIIVSNAEEELKSIMYPQCYQASKCYAAGVLEGLGFWGVAQDELTHAR